MIFAKDQAEVIAKAFGVSERDALRLQEFYWDESPATPTVLSSDNLALVLRSRFPIFFRVNPQNVQASVFDLNESSLTPTLEILSRGGMIKLFELLQKSLMVTEQITSNGDAVAIANQEDAHRGTLNQAEVMAILIASLTKDDPGSTVRASGSNHPGMFIS
jgi:hypothetical protein